MLATQQQQQQKQLLLQHEAGLMKGRKNKRKCLQPKRLLVTTPDSTNNASFRPELGSDGESSTTNSLRSSPSPELSSCAVSRTPEAGCRLQPPLKKRYKLPLVPLAPPVAAVPSDPRSPSCEEESCQQPFRPWVASQPHFDLLSRVNLCLPLQEEPLALVVAKDCPSDQSSSRPSSNGPAESPSRSYKALSRERRIEANARERQRVHTITAAFDRLQHVLPLFAGSDTTSVGGDHQNKLSKLAVIKIATSYITVLSRLAGYDYSPDQSAPSVEECIRQCSELVQAECRLKRKDGF